MNGVKRCAKCHEVKPLAEFPPNKGRRDGRHSWCRVCKAKHRRELRWKQQGIPPEEWPRLHQEAEAQAARRNSVPDGFKVCSRCDEVKSLEEFPPNKGTRDGRDSWCRVCMRRYLREARWKKQGIPESDWPQLHQEVDRKTERQRIMRELAKQYGLKYCADCDMCLGRAYFRRDSSRADGLQRTCKACQSARVAAYYRTDAGRAAKKGRKHRRRARLRDLPTDGSGPADWAAHAEDTDDFCCHLCGGELAADDVIHWDHLDPISTGTTGTVLHNMHAAHEACNLARGNRPLAEWWDSVELPDEVA